MNNNGKAVLSLCDRTGIAVQDWANAGYECFCVDLANENRTVGNIHFVQADIKTYLPPLRSYAFCFAFPPCTDLAVSGAKYFKSKGLGKLVAALELVDRCRMICEWAECPYLLENPIGTLSTYWRTPDYIFDPCDYANYLDNPSENAYTKKTCLWVGGGFKMPEYQGVEPIKVCPQGSWLQRLGGKSERTKYLRSATPKGFSRAVYQANAPA